MKKKQGVEWWHVVLVVVAVLLLHRSGFFSVVHYYDNEFSLCVDDYESPTYFFGEGDLFDYHFVMESVGSYDVGLTVTNDGKEYYVKTVTNADFHPGCGSLTHPDSSVENFGSTKYDFKQHSYYGCPDGSLNFPLYFLNGDITNNESSADLVITGCYRQLHWTDTELIPSNVVYCGFEWNKPLPIKTKEVYDDFVDGSINSSLWTKTVYGGSVSESGYKLHTRADSSGYDYLFGKVVSTKDFTTLFTDGSFNLSFDYAHIQAYRTCTGYCTGRARIGLSNGVDEVYIQAQASGSGDNSYPNGIVIEHTYSDLRIMYDSSSEIVSIYDGSTLLESGSLPDPAYIFLESRANEGSASGGCIGYADIGNVSYGIVSAELGGVNMPSDCPFPDIQYPDFSSDYFVWKNVTWTHTPQELACQSQIVNVSSEGIHVSTLGPDTSSSNECNSEEYNGKMFVESSLNLCDYGMVQVTGSMDMFFDSPLHYGIGEMTGNFTGISLHHRGSDIVQHYVSTNPLYTLVFKDNRHQLKVVDDEGTLNYVSCPQLFSFSSDTRGYHQIMTTGDIYIYDLIFDTDGDTIWDEDDECPSVPGISMYAGCPAPGSSNETTPILYLCWNGEYLTSPDDCPAKIVDKYVCWNGIIVNDIVDCDTPPENTTEIVSQYICWEGTTVTYQNDCPAPTETHGPTTIVESITQTVKTEWPTTLAMLIGAGFALLAILKWQKK